MDKKIIALIIVLVGTALVFGGWWLSTSDNSVTDNGAEVTQQETDGITEPELIAEFTTAEIAAHNSQSDCWTYIGGSVYDITAYIPIHPGGAEVLRACGGDGTSLFTQRTTVDGEAVGSGGSHSQNAFSQLGQYFVGNLAI